MTPPVTDSKEKVVLFAKREASLKLKGNATKAGPEIEKFLSPFRKTFAENDPRFLDLNFGADWCAVFVYFILTTAGYALKIRPFEDKKGTFGLVGIWADWARSQGTLKDRAYEPVPGDLVIYNKLVSDQDLDHIGIVLENAPGYLVTAEGNVENKTGLFKREKNETIAWYIHL